MLAFCDDCTRSYTCEPQVHMLYCEARTCCVCLETFGNILTPNVYGERVCYKCQNDNDVELLYSGTEEGMEEMN